MPSVIQVPPGRAAVTEEQARITAGKSRSRESSKLLAVAPDLLDARNFRIVAETWSSSGKRTKRGSGLHQSMGSPSENQGKMPCL